MAGASQKSVHFSSSCCYVKIALKLPWNLFGRLSNLISFLIWPQTAASASGQANSPVSASQLGPGVDPKVASWVSRVCMTAVLWELHGPPSIHLPTLPLTKVTLLTPPHCPFLTLIPLLPSAVFPWSAVQTWLFLLWILDFWTSTYRPISFHLSGFSLAFPAFLDLNLDFVAQNLPIDVIFSWSISTPAMAVIRGKCFMYCHLLPPKNLCLCLKHHYWVMFVIPKSLLLLLFLYSWFGMNPHLAILISSALIYSLILALPLVRQEVADRSYTLKTDFAGEGRGQKDVLLSHTWSTIPNGLFETSTSTT